MALANRQSPEFIQRMNTVSEQFLAMQADLAKEKQSTQQGWATREKRIQLIVAQTGRFVGDLQALYGSVLPQLPAFEIALESNGEQTGNTAPGKD